MSDDKIPSSEISENDILPRAELPGIYPDEEANETEYEENYSEYSSELFKDQPEIAATEETTESETGTVSGSCGDDVSFTLDLSTGKLIISGTGDMDFRTVYTSDVPFYKYKDKITEIEIIKNTSERGKKVTGKEEISKIISELKDNSESTKKESVSDEPTNTEDYICIKFYHDNADDSPSIVYLYKDKDDSFIEQPYSGIWKLKNEIFDNISENLIE